VPAATKLATAVFRPVTACANVPIWANNAAKTKSVEGPEPEAPPAAGAAPDPDAPPPAGAETLLSATSDAETPTTTGDTVDGLPDPKPPPTTLDGVEDVFATTVGVFNAAAYPTREGVAELGPATSESDGGSLSESSTLPFPFPRFTSFDIRSRGHVRTNKKKSELKFNLKI
jgi:hypothetical protein